MAKSKRRVWTEYTKLASLTDRIASGEPLQEEDIMTPQQAAEQGLIESYMVEYWEAYDKAQSELINHSEEIADFKINQALEKAKRLSANTAFLTTLQDVRDRWGISPHLPLADTEQYLLVPENVLANSVFDQDLSKEDQEQLESDLKLKLCKPFGLDPLHDYGLVVMALCFGLTPEILANHWEKIWFTAAKEQSPGVTILIHRDPVKKYMSALLTIAYLTKQLYDAGVNLYTLPESIRKWMHHSIETTGKYGGAAPVLIDKLHSQPQDQPDVEPELYIRIRPDTSKADILRTWPQIELRKVELWGRKNSGKTARRMRKWKTYNRDVELARLYKELADYDEVVREYEKDHPHELVVDYSDSGQPLISDDVRDLVRQAVKRVRDRVTRESDS